MDFRLPGKAERLRAIGSTEELHETLRFALDPGSDFEPIPVPKPGDWLAEHHEPGQSFDDFVSFWINIFRRVARERNPQVL